MIFQPADSSSGLGSPFWQLRAQGRHAPRTGTFHERAPHTHIHTHADSGNADAPIHLTGTPLGLWEETKMPRENP